MKQLATLAIIAISLLIATGCNKQQNESNNEPLAQEVSTNSGSQQNQDAPAVDEPLAQEVSTNSGSQQNQDAPAVDELQPEPSVAQNPSEDADVQANQELPPEPPDPSGYVDIADWCRPGMTDPITAQEWAKANNAFGLKVLRLTKGNSIFSPYSIERALGMTLDGACGTTATEMLAALEMPNARRLSLSGRDVDDAMKSVNADTMLEIENTLWPDKSMTLPDDFLARISAGYRDKTVALDYAADPEKARITINNDVTRSTHDRITGLIPKGSIRRETRLVITNAVFFKSKWHHQFKPEETKSEFFYNSDKQIKTKIMHQIGGNHDVGNRNVCIADDYAIYDLEFNSAKEGKKGAYFMRIVLPKINDRHPMDKRMEQLDKVEKQLSGDLTSGCRNYRFDNVYVSLPKFKLTPGTMSINDMLQSMGMKKAFSDNAEFYAMPNTTPKPSDPSKYMMISDVLHKAFIEIDEKGGEAAAKTAVIMRRELCLDCGGDGGGKPRDYYFTVDHPFIYMIIEKSTGAAIFMGRVTDL